MCDGSLVNMREALRISMTGTQEECETLKTIKLKQEYKANVDNMRAFDHAVKLSFAQEGLLKFKVYMLSYLIAQAPLPPVPISEMVREEGVVFGLGM